MFICPSCQQNLTLSGGPIVCVGCGREFPVTDGIPILVDLTKLPKHLAGQVKYFAAESIIDHSQRIDPWQQRYVDRFLEHFPVVADKVVLDCATGSGYMAIALAQRGARVIATDLTLANLVSLRAVVERLKLQDRITLVCADAQALPVADSVVDFFISNAILEHLPDEAHAIAEMDRLVVSGGGLMIAVPLKYRYLWPWLLPLNLLHDRLIGHLRRYDAATLRHRLGHWQGRAFVYTGHWGKVWAAIRQRLGWPVNHDMVEQADQRLEHRPYGASNIVGIFIKQ